MNNNRDEKGRFVSEPIYWISAEEKEKTLNWIATSPKEEIFESYEKNRKRLLDAERETFDRLCEVIDKRNETIEELETAIAESEDVINEEANVVLELETKIADAEERINYYEEIKVLKKAIMDNQKKTIDEQAAEIDSLKEELENVTISLTENIDLSDEQAAFLEKYESTRSAYQKVLADIITDDTYTG